MLGRYLTMPEAAAMGYVDMFVRDDGGVQSMKTPGGYCVTYGAPSYRCAVARADATALNPTSTGEGDGR